MKCVPLQIKSQCPSVTVHCFGCKQVRFKQISGFRIQGSNARQIIWYYQTNNTNISKEHTGQHNLVTCQKLHFEKGGLGQLLCCSFEDTSIILSLRSPVQIPLIVWELLIIWVLILWPKYWPQLVLLSSLRTPVTGNAPNGKQIQLYFIVHWGPTFL